MSFDVKVNEYTYTIPCVRIYKDDDDDDDNDDDVLIVVFTDDIHNNTEKYDADTIYINMAGMTQKLTVKSNPSSVRTCIEILCGCLYSYSNEDEEEEEDKEEEVSLITRGQQLLNIYNENKNEELEKVYQNNKNKNKNKVVVELEKVYTSMLFKFSYKTTIYVIYRDGNVLFKDTIMKICKQLYDQGDVNVIVTDYKPPNKKRLSTIPENPEGDTVNKFDKMFHRRELKHKKLMEHAKRLIQMMKKKDNTTSDLSELTEIVFEYLKEHYDENYTDEEWINKVLKKFSDDVQQYRENFLTKLYDPNLASTPLEGLVTKKIFFNIDYTEEELNNIVKDNFLDYYYVKNLFNTLKEERMTKYKNFVRELLKKYPYKFSEFTDKQLEQMIMDNGNNTWKFAEKRIFIKTYIELNNILNELSKNHKLYKKNLEELKEKYKVFEDYFDSIVNLNNEIPYGDYHMV